MNERIRELAEQAGVTISGYNDNNSGYYETSGSSSEELEKFAELIVAECEQAIRAEVAITDISGEVEKAWGMGMECGVYTIKKHFGVEP